MEAKIDAHYDDLNVLMAQHSFGRHVLPVSLVLSPEERYRARVAKQENVDALERSLLSFGSVNEHVEVVLFVSRGKTLPVKAGFKPPLTEDELKTRGLSKATTPSVEITPKGLCTWGYEPAAPPVRQEPEVEESVVHRLCLFAWKRKLRSAQKLGES